MGMKFIIFVAKTRIFKKTEISPRVTILPISSPILFYDAYITGQMV